MKNNAAKFAHEFARMCKVHDGCVTDTACCPLYNIRGEDINCVEAFMKCPERVVDIVQQWSEAFPIRPQKTILSEFLAKFPDTKLNEDGTPKFCVKILGYNYIGQDMCKANKGQCSLCWNTPLFEEEKAKPKPAPKAPLKDVIIIGAMPKDEDPDGAYFDHVPAPKSSVVTAPELPQGMNSFIRELCSHLGWENPTTV